jgi:spermidine/putrescine transport system ATP-binding protein
MLCLRPEAIATGAGPVPLGTARVRDAAFFGTHVRAHLVPDAAPGLTLIAHLSPDALPAPGDTLTLSTTASALLAFPAAKD